MNDKTFYVSFGGGFYQMGQNPFHRGFTHDACCKITLPFWGTRDHAAELFQAAYGIWYCSIYEEQQDFMIRISCEMNINSKEDFEMQLAILKFERETVYVPELIKYIEHEGYDVEKKKKVNNAETT